MYVLPNGTNFERRMRSASSLEILARPTIFTPFALFHRPCCAFSRVNPLPEVGVVSGAFPALSARRLKKGDLVPSANPAPESWVAAAAPPPAALAGAGRGGSRLGLLLLRELGSWLWFPPHGVDAAEAPLKEVTSGDARDAQTGMVATVEF